MAPPSLWQATVVPFQEFFQRRALGPAMAVLAFMVFYKLGDNMATALATPFYLDMGFSTETIGLVAKGVSLWAVILGSVIGAFVVASIGINRSLWIFGLVQMVTILGFVWLTYAGADPWVLGIVIAGEYVGVGLGTTASVAFIARETSEARRSDAICHVYGVGIVAKGRGLELQRRHRGCHRLDGVFLS